MAGDDGPWSITGTTVFIGFIPGSGKSEVADTKGTYAGRKNHS
jgi:hypothetical protein